MTKKWKCSEDDGTESYMHQTQCTQCWGECGGTMCVDCFARIYEGYDNEEGEEDDD